MGRIEFSKKQEERAKIESRYVEIKGVIDMSKSPASGEKFVGSLNQWLDKSDWEFIGQLGVAHPKTELEELLPEASNAITLKTVIAFIKSMIIYALGILITVYSLYVPNTSDYVRMLGIAIVWFSGTYFGRRN